MVRFDDAVAKIGADLIRHMFASPAAPSRSAFGFEAARDVKRRFLTFWNVYRLFVTYANVDRPPSRSRRAFRCTWRRSSNGC